MVDLGTLADEVRAKMGDTARRVTAVLPLWVLIVIVIVGAGLVALAAGLCCLCACRRRRRGNRSGKVVLLADGCVSGPASDGCSSNDERGRGRLRKRQYPIAGVSGDDDEVGGGGGGGDGGDDDGDDDRDGEIGFRAISPVRKFSMLVMPDLFGRRGSLNPFAAAATGGGGGGGLNISDNARFGSSGGGGQSNGRRKRTSNAWIDEDTLHGPKMTSAKSEQPSSRKAKMKSLRKSIRESWPLKTLSPTLPRLPQFDGREGEAGAGGHDSLAMFQYQTYNSQVYPKVLPVPGLVARDYDGQGSSPPRPLPKPPKQALLAANEASAGGNRTSSWSGARSMGDIVPRNRGLSYYKFEGTDEPVKSTNSLCTKPGGGVGVDTGVAGPKGIRLSPTGSTLSGILKDTEMRLQEGTATGAARKNLVSTSSPKRSIAAPEGSTATLVGSAPRTPSPVKPNKTLPGSAGTASTHVRQESDASVLSEADSMIAEASPGPQPQYHGLTSPSRSKPQQQQQQQQQQPQQQSPHRRKLSRAASFTSSIASSLSDISEENSMVSGTTPNTTAPSSSIPSYMTKNAEAASDPFMATKDTSPANGSAGSRNRDVYPASRGAHGALDRLRGRQTSDDTLYTIAQSPLSLVSGNSRSPEPSPTRNLTQTNRTKASQSQRNQPSTVDLPAPASTDSPSDNINKRTTPVPNTLAGMAIPNLSLTSPSVDSDSPSPKRPGGPRRLDSSPILVHGMQPQNREKSPDMVPPSPAMSRLSSVYDCYAEMHTDPPSSSLFTASNRRRAAGEVRMISEDASSSCYSDQEAYAREKTAALNELNALLNLDIRTGQQQPPSRATVRFVPLDPEQSSSGSDTSPQVSATVAELRRMNSQISAAASGYSDDSAAATARPEVVSPPRRGAAARNYLAVGSSPETSPVGRHRDKENDRLVVGAPKTPGAGSSSVGLDENVTLRTPVRNRAYDKIRGGDEDGRRKSEESLGLYDEDGFLISPERRLGLRT